MQPPKRAIEAMGFEEIANGMEIEATFNLVKAYQFRGITLSEAEADSIVNLCHKNQDFAFGFGNSLNELYQHLCDKNLADDKDNQSKNNGKNSPSLFLIIHISLNKFFVCRSGYWKKEKEGYKESFVTYDGFPEARELLKKKEFRIVSPLLASLSVQLSFFHRPIRFVPLFHEIYGKTKMGENVYDQKIEMAMDVSISTILNPTRVKAGIQDSLKLYDQLDFEVSSLFHAALEEKDRLKQFLNFFFVLERYTNQVFEKIDFKDYLTKAKITPDRIKVASEEFFLKQQTKSRALLLRFKWCALLVWESINDKDIEDFKSVKEVRDRIAHGKNASEAILPTAIAEQLCLKLLSSYC